MITDLEPRDCSTFACRVCDAEFYEPELIHVLRCIHWDGNRVVLFRNLHNPDEREFSVVKYRPVVGTTLRFTTDSMASALDAFDYLAEWITKP